jgi:ech hydrogenase subunit F
MLFKITKTVVKSIFKKAATRRYPKEIRPPFPGTRGQIINHIDLCIFCGICDKKCPTMAIKVTKEPKHWEINHLKCIQCRNCVELCPKKCLEQLGQSAPPVAKKEDAIVGGTPGTKAS